MNYQRTLELLESNQDELFNKLISELNELSLELSREDLTDVSFDECGDGDIHIESESLEDRGVGLVVLVGDRVPMIGEVELNITVGGEELVVVLISY